MDIDVKEWEKIKSDFINTEMNLKQIARKHKISYSYLRKVSAKEKWYAEKDLKNAISEITIIENQDNNTDTDKPNKVTLLSNVKMLTKREKNWKAGIIAPIEENGDEEHLLTLQLLHNKIRKLAQKDHIDIWNRRTEEVEQVDFTPKMLQELASAMEKIQKCQKLALNKKGLEDEEGKKDDIFFIKGLDEKNI